MGQLVLSWVLSHPAELLTFGLAVVSWVKGKDWVKAKMGSDRAKLILHLAEVAFWAVEEANRLHPLPDSVAKTTAFLQKLIDAAKAAGLGELTPAEVEMAKQKADALHYAAKQAEDVMPNSDQNTLGG